MTEKALLERSFVHLPGVGKARERILWEEGIVSWQQLLDLGPGGTPVRLTDDAWRLLEKSIEHRNDLAFFSSHFSPTEQWRLYAAFVDRIIYLDIETDGRKNPDSITSICTFDGQEIRLFIRGDNLLEAVEFLADASILVTFFGRQFDVPMIQNNLNIKITDLHLDLYAIFRSLDVRGGLKKIEQRFGIDRGGLEGVDGYFAVLFWRYYKNTGDRRALETLLAYNIEDTVNLYRLAHIAYNRKLEQVGFPELKIPEPETGHVKPPYEPSPEIVRLAREFISGVRY